MADEKELKDQRVVTMMTPSDLEAIDDWMFKNRIRSRGEAIRRLCQMGLIFDTAGDEMFLASDRLTGMLGRLIVSMRDQLRAKRGEGDPDLFFPAVLAIGVPSLHRKAVDLEKLIATAISPARQRRSASEMELIETNLRDAIEELREFAERFGKDRPNGLILRPEQATEFFKNFTGSGYPVPPDEDDPEE